MMEKKKTISELYNTQEYISDMGKKRDEVSSI